jgi:hypothetical protein
VLGVLAVLAVGGGDGDAGVFGPASSARKQLRALVPDAALATTASPRCPAPGAPASSRRRRLPWADLLRRVFAQDFWPARVAVVALSRRSWWIPPWRAGC